ncbi:thioesterase [Nocardioides szechwanensis]|uniref:Acyl-CoA thioester hydrolase n=1 Tax=Nocardioides szechwanensis TaxID=1005944 RepID=A0A1H0KXU7_9ACTN|nr:acyl-CoA thioesterase [Nocardioides szechwanensis]GEP35550.1 thioesterase [Nocardioides szechwanensis]SDO60685.1 acyl-CoA thioester hydrolase [Nocardioides szechwanensis]
MGEMFDCEIQARYRDVNLGGHVDNVEAIRLIDEARIQFLRFSPLSADAAPGLLADLPSGVVELVGSQRVDYHAEMRFAPFQPFLVRIWVSRIGGSSFSVATEVRVAPGHAPALVAETALVLWDHNTQSSWQHSDVVRRSLERYLGEPVGLRS